MLSFKKKKKFENLFFLGEWGGVSTKHAKPCQNK